MKIGILTQPLTTNYGGLLQAFALQMTLKRMGHEVWTIDRQEKRTSLLVRILSIVKRLICRILFHEKIVVRALPLKNEQNIIVQHTNRFINENISTTERIDSLRKLYFLNKYQFDVYVVGSDQVWRPNYSPCLTNYFLDFLDEKDEVKRIAYAASFGEDNWTFSHEQTAYCKLLTDRFNAISVREDSAIELCKENFEVTAEHVLDPTMLLAKEDYIELVERDYILENKGNLMTYILDKSSEKGKVVQKVAKELNLVSFTVFPKNTFEEVGNKHVDDCIFPPVTEWIRGFMDAKYIVTDSFHGTVFSIIFNKPFILIGNVERGMSRFTSLLKLFGLEDRLILSLNELTLEKINNPIDFSQVNRIWDQERLHSLDFLNKALQ